MALEARERGERKISSPRAQGLGPTVFWEWDTRSNQVLFSLSFKQLLGYEDDEFPDRYESWESRLHEDDREATLAALDAHLMHDTKYDVEYRLLCKSGEYRWFRARGQAEPRCARTARLDGWLNQ